MVVYIIYQEVHKKKKIKYDIILFSYYNIESTRLTEPNKKCNPFYW